MATKDFTAKQKEILARKMGYDGPMQGFDEYLKSDPALARKYGAVLDKYMARGGMAKKYAAGGLAFTVSKESSAEDKINEYARLLQEGYSNEQIRTAAEAKFGTQTDSDWGYLTSKAAEKLTTLNAAKPVKDLAFTVSKESSAEDKINEYARLLQKGYSNEEIRTAADAKFGTQTDSDWGYLTSKAAEKLTILNAAKPTVTAGSKVTIDPITGKPIAPTAPTITAGTIISSPEETLKSSGAAADAAQATAKQIDTVQQVETPTPVEYKAVTAETTAEETAKALEKVKPVQGTVSESAQVAAQEGTVSAGSMAEAATFDQAYYKPVEAGTRTTEAGELVTAVKGEAAPVVQVAQAERPEAVKGLTREITAEELVKAEEIQEKDMAQAEAIVAEGLAPDAIAVAAKLDKFTVSDQTLAEAVEGKVDSLATVQGQLAEIMKSFNDGTPAWASGAIRAANALMSSRGLGASSMMGAAILQAAMESALPIAQQDAKTFADMGLANLDNKQKVALANAAAQQDLALANLNNEQQAALQNSNNAFNLQMQNLSNTQQTIIANAQIRASLQGQNLSNRQQAAIANAARIAEVNNINLNNLQQAALQTSANNVQIDIANLSAKQQTYIAQAQLDAALQLKNIDNAQQAAVLNAARIAENNNITFDAKQKAAIHNSTLLQTIGVANLNAKQAAILQNAATVASMDLANLNNRQQAAVVNAQSFLAMDMANLDNEQQAEMFKAEAIKESIFTDTAARNAMAQINATNELQNDQFFASLSNNTSQFNASQQNAMAEFNVSQANALAQFNTQQQNIRDQFNAENQRIIDQSNAEWRRSITLANTEAANRAAEINAKNALDITTAEYNATWQAYRDDIEFAWKTADNQADRDNQIALQVISKEAQIESAKMQADALKYQALGGAAATILGKTSFGEAILKGTSDLAKRIFGEDGTADWTQTGFNTFESELGNLRIDEEGNYWMNDELIWTNPDPFED